MNLWEQHWRRAFWTGGLVGFTVGMIIASLIWARLAPAAPMIELPYVGGVLCAHEAKGFWHYWDGRADGMCYSVDDPLKGVE